MKRIATFLACLLLAFAPAVSIPAELKVNDSGTWRTITELKINDSGTWRTIQEVYVNDSGTWRSVFSAVPGTVNMSSIDEGVVQDYGFIGLVDSARVTVFFKTDGSVTAAAHALGGDIEDPFGQWLTAGTNDGEFEVRFTCNGGCTDTGDSDPYLQANGSDISLGGSSAWIPLDTDVSIFFHTVAGGYSSDITAEIRYNGGSVIASADFTMNITMDP